MLTREEILDSLKNLIATAEGSDTPPPPPPTSPFQTRTNLGVGLTADGRTQFEPSTNLIVADQTLPLDAAIKLLSPERPHIYCETPQTMTTRFELSGPSPDKPYVIFGGGHKLSGFRIDRVPVHNFAIVNAELYRPLLRVPSDRILFENCLIHTGECQSRALDQPALDLCVRLCDIRNSNPTGKDQAFYIYNTQGILFESCIFRGFWDRNLTSVPDLLRSHLLYVNEPSSPADLVRCIFTGAASHGSFLRSGGTVTDCWYDGNPIAHQHGYGSIPGQASGLIERVIVTNGIDLAPGHPRSWGLVFEDVSQATAQDCLFYKGVPGGAPVVIRRGIGTIGEVELSNLRASDWPGAVRDAQSGSGTVQSYNNNWEDTFQIHFPMFPGRFTSVLEAHDFFRGYID